MKKNYTYFCDFCGKSCDVYGNHATHIRGTTTCGDCKKKEEEEEMSRYKTRPIDYTGCNPVIAEHLKKSKDIECKVWDVKSENSNKGFVVGYMSSSNYKYLVDFGDGDMDTMRHAEPIPTMNRFRKASWIIKWLEDNGWKYYNMSEAYYKDSHRVNIADIHNIAGFKFGPDGYPFIPSLAERFPEWLEDEV